MNKQFTVIVLSSLAGAIIAACALMGSLANYKEK